MRQVVTEAATPRRGRGLRRRTRNKRQDAVGTYFGDAWSLAKRTAVGLNEIRKLINVEQKFIDVNTAQTAGQSGTVVYLTPVVQGDNISEREGDSIKVQSFRLLGTIRRDVAAGATVVEAFRLLVVRDLQNAAAAPLASDVLETVGTSSAPYQFLDFLNGAQLNKRFTVVYDTMQLLDLYHPIVSVDFSTNHDCHVMFRGTTSGTGSAGNGSYWLILVSSSTLTLPTFEGMTRLCFTDN